MVEGDTEVQMNLFSLKHISDIHGFQLILWLKYFPSQKCLFLFSNLKLPLNELIFFSAVEYPEPHMAVSAEMTKINIM